MNDYWMIESAFDGKEEKKIIEIKRNILTNIINEQSKKIV